MHYGTYGLHGIASDLIPTRWPKDRLLRGCGGGHKASGCEELEEGEVNSTGLRTVFVLCDEGGEEEAKKREIRGGNLIV